MRVVAMLLAGGEGTRLTVLSAKRAKPSVPFGGKYRIIDFTLSNCVNSGIFNVAVLTQYRPHSLNTHIGIGRPWDLDRMRGGVRLLQPYQGRGHEEWYRGTADAVLQNLNYIVERRADTVIILSGDHIYKMDYREMLAYHQQKGADDYQPLFVFTYKSVSYQAPSRDLNQLPITKGHDFLTQCRCFDFAQHDKSLILLPPLIPNPQNHHAQIHQHKKGISQCILKKLPISKETHAQKNQITPRIDPGHQSYQRNRCLTIFVNRHNEQSNSGHNRS